MYTVHLWLFGKRMVNFLIVLIQLFRHLSRLRCYEQILVEIVVFERGWVTLSTNIRSNGGRPLTSVRVSKLKSLALFA